MLRDLPDEAKALLTQGNIITPEETISDEVVPILLKLWNGEKLTRGDLGEEVTSSEVAAIWSILYKTPIKTEYVRQVKRAGRIVPSKEWGRGSSYRCLYKVRTILTIVVGHQRGRPSKKQALQS